MGGPIYVFGDYRFSAVRRELWRGGTLVQLSPKAFDCLAYLVEHHDRAVGRDELISAIWGETEATDMQVAQAVLRARRAVGDTGDDQQWIRTIPRFGYRWSADVRAEDAPTPTENGATGSPTPILATTNVAVAEPVVVLTPPLAEAALPLSEPAVLAQVPRAPSARSRWPWLIARRPAVARRDGIHRLVSDAHGWRYGSCWSHQRCRAD
jgi:DNA-binding winged helix-turn-helix (wHTH) protein